MKFADKFANCEVGARFVSQMYKRDSLRFVYFWILRRQPLLFEVFGQAGPVDSFLLRSCSKLSSESIPPPGKPKFSANPILVRLLDSFDAIRKHKKKKRVFRLVLSLFATFERSWGAEPPVRTAPPVPVATSAQPLVDYLGLQRVFESFESFCKNVLRFDLNRFLDTACSNYLKLFGRVHVYAQLGALQTACLADGRVDFLQDICGFLDAQQASKAFAAFFESMLLSLWHVRNVCRVLQAQVLSDLDLGVYISNHFG